MRKEELSLQTTFKFYAQEGDFFGAYAAGSMTDGEPVILVNMEGIAHAVNDTNPEVRPEVFRDMVLQSITHEFIHALQEWLGKSFDEHEVEKIMGSYNEKWNILSEPIPDEEIDEVLSVRLTDVINIIDNVKAETVEEFRQKLKEPFIPHLSWLEANDKAKEEAQKTVS